MHLLNSLVVEFLLSSEFIYQWVAVFVKLLIGQTKLSENFEIQVERVVRVVDELLLDLDDFLVLRLQIIVGNMGLIWLILSRGISFFCSILRF